MNLGHPVLQNMIKLGCKSQIKISLAFQTYMELCEVHKAQDVDYFYDTELDLIYLVAQSNGEEEVYIPLLINEKLTPKKIKSYQNISSKHCESKVMNLALRDVDTSCVMYKISSGLENPLSPEITKEKKDLKEKRGLVEAEISNLLPTLIIQARKHKLVTED